jgi:hypothetical protein
MWPSLRARLRYTNASMSCVDRYDSEIVRNGWDLAGEKKSAVE